MVLEHVRPLTEGKKQTHTSRHNRHENRRNGQLRPQNRAQGRDPRDKSRLQTINIKLWKDITADSRRNWPLKIDKTVENGHNIPPRTATATAKLTQQLRTGTTTENRYNNWEQTQQLRTDPTTENRPNNWEQTQQLRINITVDSRQKPQTHRLRSCATAQNRHKRLRQTHRLKTDTRDHKEQT